MGETWVIGVLCSLAACFGTVSGMMMQKWSHMKNEALPVNLRKPSHKRPLWWCSLFLMIVVPAPLDVASLALAAQSLLAPLSAVTLLLNALLSPCCLGETLTRIDIIATGLIFVGATLTTLFGNHSQETYTVPELYVLYNRVEFIIYQVVVVVGFCWLYYFIRQTTPMKEEWDKRERSPSGRSKQEMPWKIKMLPFAYGLLAGLAGAQQNVTIKSVSELLFKSFDGNNQMKYPFTYFLTGVAIFMAIFQISYVSKGLEIADAVFYLPIYNAFLIVLSVLSGSIYFNEVRQTTVTSALVFLLGLTITLSGVLVLTKQKPKVHEAADEPDQVGNLELGVYLLPDGHVPSAEDPDDEPAAVAESPSSSSHAAAGASSSSSGSLSHRKDGYDRVASQELDLDDDGMDRAEAEAAAELGITSPSAGGGGNGERRGSARSRGRPSPSSAGVTQL